MKKCPICNKKFEKHEAYPFCSARCKNVDLNRWLKEVYSVPEKNHENNTGQSDEINLYED